MRGCCELLWDFLSFSSLFFSISAPSVLQKKKLNGLATLRGYFWAQNSNRKERRKSVLECPKKTPNNSTLNFPIGFASEIVRIIYIVDWFLTFFSLNLADIAPNFEGRSHPLTMGGCKTQFPLFWRIDICLFPPLFTRERKCLHSPPGYREKVFFSVCGKTGEVFFP